jgi:pimeloyl-ACP methyl ester carboxylesterase
VFAWAYVAYRKELEAACRRIAMESQFIDSPQGPIEFAESGDGPAALVIHGAGGGFDQGLDLGRAFLGDRFRVIAPSRFGYLGTPLPADTSPEAQAVAHLRLLDALQLEAVPVIGISAGAPSALQLALQHPERCSSLILVVPLVWSLEHTEDPPSPLVEFVLNAVGYSDFLYWTATKVARTTLLKSILGTPARECRTAADRATVDRMLRSILPISRRAAGIENDSFVSLHLTRDALETLRVPTLVISAADDLYGTYERGRATAMEIPDATFIGFPAGGHLLLGHETMVRAQIHEFLVEHRSVSGGIANAV